MFKILQDNELILDHFQDINDFLLLGSSHDTSPGEVLDKVARRLRVHTIIPELRDVSGQVNFFSKIRIFPVTFVECVLLIVSFQAKPCLNGIKISQTLEAFCNDLLSTIYLGGRAIEILGQNGNTEAIKFPVTLAHER